MKPINELLITPKKGNRYDNHSRLGDGKLIINTSIESHTHVNRVGVVEEIPINIKGLLVLVMRLYYTIMFLEYIMT